MKLIPLLVLLAAAFFCGSLKQLVGTNPTPAPLPSASPLPRFDEDPPPPPPPPADLSPGNTSVKSVPKTISGGVLNGKAKTLPTPSYPPAARAVRATGSVNVQVLINESGKVESAKALSGHPLLRAAAEQAARAAQFEPTRLSGAPVKVSGILTFNFQL